MGEEDWEEGCPMIRGLTLPLTPNLDGGVFGLDDDELWLLPGEEREERRRNRN